MHRVVTDAWCSVALALPCVHFSSGYKKVGFFEGTHYSLVGETSK